MKMDEIVVANLYYLKSISEKHAMVNNSPTIFLLSSDDEELPPFQLSKCDDESIQRKENPKILCNDYKISAISTKKI